MPSWSGGCREGCLPVRRAGACRREVVMRSSERKRLAVVLLLGLLCPAVAGAASADDLVGVWKMCFEPGLPGVDEPSEGYLVLLPDQRYFEMRVDCCALEEDSVGRKLFSYRVDGDVVVLNGTNMYGRPTERRFTIVTDAEVVFFDDLDGPPVRATVLKIGRDLSYGFARVYPLTD